MKKQILTLIVAIIAIGFSTAYGQNCTPSPLAPAAGVPYNYSATISGSGYDGAGPFTWYVTQAVNLLDATQIVVNNGGEIIASGVGAYNAPINGADSITIVWTSQAVADGAPYYLVIKYSQANSTTNPTCSAMNMKVWEIKPINKFLLAINPFAGAIGMGGVYCSADITSAIVTPGAPTVAYIYGVNTIYAEITPSFYAGPWTPSFQITGLDAIQNIVSVDWDVAPNGTYANSTTLQGGLGYVSNSNATSAYDGSSKIYVRVTVNNNYFENLGGQTVNIGVDGIIPVVTGSPLADVISDADCNPEIPFGKNANLTINPRPTITGNPTPFITKNP